jgi:hypothetical protein
MSSLKLISQQLHVSLPTLYLQIGQSYFNLLKLNLLMTIFLLIPSSILTGNSSSQREHTTNLPSTLSSNGPDPPLITTSSFNEPPIVPTLPSSTHHTVNSVPFGWNSSHHYNTRFRHRIIANVASPSSSDSDIDSTVYTALLAAQDSSLSLDSQFPYQLAFTATNNPDTLHYGRMKHDPDRPHFEKDMQ